MTTSTVPDRIPASQAQLLDDVGRTLDAWRRAPLLPLLILLSALVTVAAGSDEPGVLFPATLLGLLLVGWPGAQRLWYLRLWTGRTLTPAEAARATLRCFGRFFVLGLVVGLSAAVLAIPAIVAVVLAADFGPDGAPTFPEGVPGWALVYIALLSVAGYALLTFVTPALVYSSKRVSEAIPIGLRLLRRSWPRTAAYVLVPAVLASAPTLLMDDVLAQPSAALTVLGALVAALGRGATAAYYVRCVPGAGPDGAIQLGPAPGYYPPPAQW